MVRKPTNPRLPIVALSEMKTRRGTTRTGLSELALRDGNFGLLSAFTDTTPRQNEALHAQLERDLSVLGYRYIQYSGIWEGEGKALFVWDIEPLDLFALGRKYRQDFVILKNKHVAGSYNFESSKVEAAMLIEEGIRFGKLAWDGKTEILSLTRHRFLRS